METFMLVGALTMWGFVFIIVMIGFVLNKYVK